MRLFKSKNRAIIERRLGIGDARRLEEAELAEDKAIAVFVAEVLLFGSILGL